MAHEQSGASIAGNSEKLDHLTEKIASQLWTLHDENKHLRNENLRL